MARIARHHQKPAAKAAIPAKVQETSASKKQKSTSKGGIAKKTAKEKQKPAPVGKSSPSNSNSNLPSRRSSDRRKVCVDRYGLDFRFIPRVKSPSPPSSKPAANQTKPSLNATSSKSLANQNLNNGKKKKPPQAKPSGKIATPEKKPKVPVKSKSKETSKKPEAKKTPAKAPAPKPSKSKASKPKLEKLDAVDKPSKKKPEPAQVADDEVKVPPAKKRKLDPSPPAGSEKKIKETIDEIAALGATGAESESDEGKEKPPVAAKKKVKPVDKNLKPKPQLKQYFHEPTFESKDELPFVSVAAYSKLAIRAVLINNENLLKRLVDDVDHVHHLNYERSIDVPFDAATYAMFNGNAKLLQLIIDEDKKPKVGRVEPTRSLLGQESTGYYNFRMLGHSVRPIQMSRGGKEGVNALTKDSGVVSVKNWISSLQDSLQRNVPFRVVQLLQLQDVLNYSVIGQHVFEAARFGHHKLAGSIAKEYGGNWFNELHIKVLLNDDEPLPPFKAISVKKKGNFNKDITPFHCACINPNEKYLAALMAVDSDYNHADANGFRAVHYAAACSSSGTLKLLLQKGAQPGELTKEGENALHRACAAGRGNNVELIVQQSKSNDPDLAITKHRSRDGYTPLHLAAKNGHLDAIKALCKSAGDALEIDQLSGPKSKAVTAVMLAAQQGHLQVVEYLVKDVGASATKLDKLKRTALVHAVINGMTHVASFLLRWGVDPDLPDSSGNTTAHYAAAYGWYFGLKLLIDAGAKLNVSNDWQLTPLAVAYMKGHMALADVLLQQPGIDINCRDNQGMTLVATTLLGTVDDSAIGQLLYLMKEKGADPTPTDTAGNTPLHLLAASNVKAKLGKNQSADDANGKLSIRLADLLMENGVKADAINDAGATAMMIAVETGKLLLARHLAEAGAKLPHVDESHANEPNVLHQLINYLVNQSDEEKSQGSLALDILNLLMKSQAQETLALLKNPDANGLTPFLLAVSKYGEKDETIKSILRNFISALLSADPSIILQRTGRVKPKEEKEEENEEDDEEDEQENGNQQTNLDLDVGRSAMHLLAVESADQSQRTDQLMSILANHIKNHKEIDCSKDRLLDSTSGSGETALFAAIKGHRSDIALQLIEIGCNVNATRRLPTALRPKTERDKNQPKIPDLVTVLMEAVRLQTAAVFEALLKAGADVHAVDSDGNSALHYACTVSPSDVSIVKQLLEAGANFEARNAKLRTPLHLVCNADTGATDVSTDTLACLLNYGADPFVRDVRGRLPLHYAFVKVGDHQATSDMDPVALCTVLLPKMAGQPQSLNSTDSFGYTPLHCAARRGANICCMTLLRHNQVDRNAKDNDGNTPLALSVLYDHMACALTLLQAEADVNVMIKQSGEKQSNEEKIWRWAPIQKSIIDHPISTLSSSVVDREWQGVVYLLIDIFTKKKQSLYPLLEAAVEHAKYNLSLTLLRMAKSHVGLLPPSGQKSGRKNLFHLLADSDRPQTASAIQLQLDLAEAILNAGVPIDEQFEDTTVFYPAFYAAKRRNVPLLKFFLERSSKSKLINQIDLGSSRRRRLDSVLTMFVWDVQPDGLGDDFQMLEQLISKYGFSLDVLSSYPVPIDFTAIDSNAVGYWTTNSVVTPLIHAIHARSFQSVKDLLKAGASVNFPDAEGITPIMHAVRLNEPDLIKLLLNIDHCKSTKELERHVDYFDQSNDEEEENEEEEDESDDGLFPPSGKRKSARPTKSRRFNVDGTIVVPTSQFSTDDPTSISNETPKRAKVAGTSKNFQKTSQLDLDAVDNQSRNVLHYVASPLDSGAWTNVGEVWNLLVGFGADAKRRDQNGLSPVDYVKRFNHSKLAEVLGLTIEGKIDSAPAILDDGRDVVDKAKRLVSVDTDAKEYLEKRKQEKAEELERNRAKLEKELERRRLRPHHLSGYSDIGEIVLDAGGTNEDGTPIEPQPYDVLLNKVDFNVGFYGFYNFYRLQLIRRKGSELYVIFTNWGRIGDSGQYQKTPFGKLADAVKEFKSIFRSKTGQDWVPQIWKKFVEQPKKYRLINKEDDQKLEESSSALDVPIDLDTALKSALPVHLQNFMATVTNAKDLAANARRVFERSRFYLTLTALKRDAILGADDVLNRIGSKLRELDVLREKAHEKEKLEEGLKIYNDVVALTTEFYFLLPLRGFERTGLSVISDLNMWKDYKASVELLLKYEVANNLFCAAAGRRLDVHPYDYIFAAVGTKMHQLDVESQESQMILHYVHNTSDQVDVTSIYKLWNEGRNEKYAKAIEAIGNRWLLWHGTNATNVLSIMQAGLLIAPPQALHTGHLFGKGIYLSDSFSKSAPYCGAASNGKKFAFLCEVALGKIARRKDIGSIMTMVDPLPEGYNSVQGVGRELPHPLYDFTLKNGVQIPFGKLIEPASKTYIWLPYNEYIVYNPDQVSLRYLLTFK